MPHEFRHGTYLISDDSARLDVDAVHAYLSRSYWAAGIPREVVARSLSNSLCLGIYAGDDKQVGLIRVVSDFATFAYLCDVYVLEEHRRHGLAKAAMQLTMSHPRLQNLRGWSLRTRDAHGLYAQFGFKPLTNPQDSMALRFPGIYNPPVSPSSDR